MGTPRRTLLERESELATLASACRAARDGQGGVVAVRGPAGIGKTTLLAEAERIGTDAGLESLRAAGSPLERDLAFAVVRQLFERPVRALAGRGAAAPPTGAAALAVPVVLEPSSEKIPEDAYAAMHGLYWLAAELAARRPLLLVVDDAHWADRPSLRWLAYLGRRLEGVPLVLVIAYRPGEPDADGRLVEQAVDEASAAVVEPPLLTEEAVGAWLAEAYGTPAAPEFGRACASVTGGNPFLLRELIGSLQADRLGPGPEAAGAVTAIAPASIGRSALLRLARMGEGAVAVAEAAAVLGPDTRLDRLSAVGRVPLDRTAELVGQLTEADILAPGEPVLFRHSLLRNAVYEQIARARRGLGHLAAAEHLLEDGAGFERAASHLLLAPPGGRTWVVETLRAAAAAALARGAPESATPLLRRALEEPPPAPAEVTLQLARAQLTGGDAEGAASSARRAIECAEEPRPRVEAALVAARALTQGQRLEEGLEILAATEADAAAVGDGELREHQAEQLTLLTWSRGVSGLRERLSALGVEKLDGSTPAERMLLSLEALEEVASARSRERAVRFARLVVRGEDLSHPSEDHMLVTAARCLGLADHLEEAIAALDAIIDGARARGALGTVSLAAGIRAKMALRAGRLDAAEADAFEALALHPDQGPWLRTALVASLTRVLVERGQPERAVEALREQGLTGELAPYYTTRLLLHARAQARAALGDVEGAIEDLRACGAAQVRWGEINPSAIPWRSDLALLLDRLDQRDEAVGLADEELRLAQAFGAARAICVAQRARALLEHGEASIDGLRAAVETLDAGPARLELARARLDLGSALRRAGRRVEARDTLARALDEADRYGAHALTARAREELAAAGARPRRARLKGVEALTAAERRVAELAASGLSNREIAQALFITTKTVEMHLNRAYGKLEIASRGELPGALGPKE
jgi:DNA-binding CsgD family transcriptional regulator